MGLQGASRFVAGPGPVISDTATVLPTDGSVLAAFDVGNFAVNESEQIALVRIEPTEGARLTDISFGPIDAEGWAVVARSAERSPSLLPAVAIETNGEVTFTLEDVDIVDVNEDGHSGVIDAEGRPQVLRFDRSGDQSWDFSGSAAFRTMFLNDPRVLPVGDGFATGEGNPARGTLTVVVGEPGSTYEVEAFEEEPLVEPEVAFDPPEPEPEVEFDPPEPEPQVPVIVDARSDAFGEFAEANGYDFVWQDQGGYFDGCNGPDDPTAVTVAYQNPAGERLLITLYDSEGQAQVSYDALADVASPCPAFPDLVVESVSAGAASTIFVLSLESDPEQFFEHYRINGDTVVVATAGEAGLGNGTALLDEFQGIS